MLGREALMSAISGALGETNLQGIGQRQAGKVRDVYIQGNRRILVTTDRISAFDRVLGVIPYKGQVLNQLSAWWFEHMKDIIDNHVIAVPDPNVTIAREAQPLPVEIVVRGYITGVTKTSLWTLYQAGERRPYGVLLPDGLQLNDPLPTPILTPTTKAEQGAHDEPLSREQIIARGLISADLWAQIEHTALAIFARGQKIAQAAGLILVDTKYEMGLIEGRLTLIDEIHTPDSSRFWMADSVRPGQTPENMDKEYLRKWFAARGYRGDGAPPPMPAEFVAEVAGRYIAAYEHLTGLPFIPGEQPVEARIARMFAGGVNERIARTGSPS